MLGNQLLFLNWRLLAVLYLALAVSFVYIPTDLQNIFNATSTPFRFTETE